MATVTKMELSGWGRYPRAQSSVQIPKNIDEVDPKLSPQLIARGMGRSYGNAAMLNDGLVVVTQHLNRSISFCQSTGLLRAEAGTTLAQILDVCVPKGWFPAVVPGTKWVSLGGCVAADIHGKNHHRDGSFAEHLQELELLLADGRKVRCSREQNAELFWATVGGMGLTGFITEVTVQLIPIGSSWMIAQHHPAPDLDSSIHLLDSPALDDAYTVVWLDCLSTGSRLGRGILIRGHHAAVEELSEKIKQRKTVKWKPAFNLGFESPMWLLNPLTVQAFNSLYYLRQGWRKESFVCDPNGFFFPLDWIGNWNRLYGKQGFIQYQCVLPLKTARQGLRALLEESQHSRCHSYLAVLKRFGPQGQGLLSFPMEGYTLTMDFPVRRNLFPFLDRVDEIVVEHGGRVYLAKDARMRPEVFRRMYPRLSEWSHTKTKVDPQNRFNSDLARRLELTFNPRTHTKT